MTNNIHNPEENSELQESFDQKYGLEQNEKTDKFHQSRRMFCIKEGEIALGPSDSPLTHADWFKNEGWIDEENDEFIKTGVRGFIDSSGNIYFYTGYDFETNNEIEAELISNLKSLAKEGNIKPNAKVFAGMIKQDKPGQWPPQKCLGTVEELIQ